MLMILQSLVLMEPAQKPLDILKFLLLDYLVQQDLRMGKM